VPSTGGCWSSSTTTPSRSIGTALGEPIVATVVYGGVAVAGLITLADHMGMYDVTDVVDSIRGSGDD